MAEDLHRIPHLYLRQVRQVHHAHIHADAAPLRCRAIGRLHRHAVGKPPEEAVGIADWQHAHTGLSLRAEGPAIADGGIRVKDLDGGHAGLQPHHRPQAQPLRVIPHAVKGDAGADHIERILGIENGRAAVAAVADLRLDAHALESAQHLREALELRMRKIRVGSVDGIRDREMHENSLDEKLGHLRNFLQLLDRLRVVIGKEAEARHARVQLDVDLEAAL